MYFIKRGSTFFGGDSLVKHVPRTNKSQALTDLSLIFRSYPEAAIRVQTNLCEEERRQSFLEDQHFDYL